MLKFVWYFTMATVFGGLALVLLASAFVVEFLAYIGLVLETIGVLVHLLAWRCPSCGKYLGRPTSLLDPPMYCQYCGTRLPIL